VAVGRCSAEPGFERDDTRHADAAAEKCLARLRMQQGSYAQKVGDDELQLTSYLKAVENGGEWISKGGYRRLMTSIISLKLRAGDYWSALGHYESFVEKAGQGAILANLQRAIDTVHKQLDIVEILDIQGGESLDLIQIMLPDDFSRRRDQFGALKEEGLT